MAVTLRRINGAEHEHEHSIVELEDRRSTYEPGTALQRHEERNQTVTGSRLRLNTESFNSVAEERVQVRTSHRLDKPGHRATAKKAR